MDRWAFPVINEWYIPNIDWVKKDQVWKNYDEDLRDVIGIVARVNVSHII